MRRLVRRLALLACAAAAGACGGDSPNPFASGTVTRTPPPSADLVFTSSAWSTALDAGREIFAVDESGSGLTQLTTCNANAGCDLAQVSPGDERDRVVALRYRDNNRDGKLTEADGGEVVFMDLARSVEKVVTPASAFVTSVDRAQTGELLVYAARGGFSSVQDVFTSDPTGAATRNLTASTDVDERSPRLDVGTRLFAFERIRAGERAVASAYFGSTQQVALTLAPTAPGAPALPGTPYLVGSDADPAFSPDAKRIVFRRLRALSADGRGAWDVVVATGDGTGIETVIATGPAWRGSPDWGPAGIVFPESDTGAAVSRLVIVQPDGSGRRVPVTVTGRLACPRWLKAAAAPAS